MIKKMSFAILSIFLFFTFSNFACAESAWTITIFAPSQEEGNIIANQLKEINPSAEISVKSNNDPAIIFGLRLAEHDVLPLSVIDITASGVAPRIARRLALVWQPENANVTHGSVTVRQNGFPLGKPFILFDGVIYWRTVCGISHCAGIEGIDAEMLTPTPNFSNNNLLIPVDNR